jgi:trans-aconitate methyltransferase
MKKNVLLICIAMLASIGKAVTAHWEPELYDAASDYQYNACLKNVAQLNIQASTTRTIIDLGCATANVSNTLAQRYPQAQVIALDADERLITYAQKKHAHTPNLTLICAHAQNCRLHELNIPLADLIICYHTLHWIPRKQVQEVFNNIAAHLAPAGIADITACAPQSNSRLAQAICTTMMQPSWHTFLAHITTYAHKTPTRFMPEQLREYATRAGLVVDHCELHEERIKFASKKEFALWIRCSLMPYGMSMLDEDRQNAFTQQVVDVYCSMGTGIDASHIEYRFKSVHLTAHKPE